MPGDGAAATGACFALASTAEATRVVVMGVPGNLRLLPRIGVLLRFTLLPLTTPALALRRWENGVRGWAGELLMFFGVDIALFLPSPSTSFKAAIFRKGKGEE